MRAMRAVALAALVVSLCLATARSGASGAQACAGSGSATAPRSIISATQQELASGLPGGSWDFAGGAGVVTAAAGSNVSLTCVEARNATISGVPGPRFMAPTAITLPSGATGLAMWNTTLVTDCDTVRSYQSYLCSTLALAGSLTLERGFVRVRFWQDTTTTLQNVVLTCPTPDAAAQPPCFLASVRNARELLEAFTTYAAALVQVTIVLAANVSITNVTWPASPVGVTTNVTLASSSLLDRPVLDFNLMTNVFIIAPGAVVALHNLTCANLAPTYFSPRLIYSQFGLMAERVWAFERDGLSLHLSDCTLIVPPAELSYTRYWLTFLTSPVPEAREKAAWLRVINVTVLAVNQTGVFYAYMQSFTTIYINVRLTDSLGSTYPLLPQSGVIRQLQQRNVPLTAVNVVANAADFAWAQLPNNTTPDEQGLRWVLLASNITGSSAEGAGTSGWPTTLSGSAVIGQAAIGNPWQPRLGFGGLVSGIAVPSGASLLVDQLVLSELPPKAAAYDPADPLAVLGSPLWSLGLPAGASKVSLTNCAVLVGREELRVLQQAMLPAAQAPGRSYDAAFMSAVRAFFTALDALQLAGSGAGFVAVASGATPRFAMSNVTFRLPVAADGEAATADPATAGVPEGGGSSSSSGAPVGAIVGGVVGGVCFLLLLLVVVLLVRRRWLSGPAGREAAYKRYIRSGAGAAREPGGGSSGSVGERDAAALPPPSSQEVTTSSQVLRPGARAGYADTGPSMDPKNASASASGNIRTSSATVTGLGAGGSGTFTSSSQGQGGGHGQHSPVAPVPSPGPAALGAPGATLPARGSSQAASDSFELPPTTSMLGHQAVAAAQARHGSTGHGTLSSHPSNSAAVSTAAASHLLSSQGGSSLLPGDQNSLESMRAVIQALGTNLGADRHLTVQGMLGKGAHGTVYKGTWRGLPCAIKSMIFNSENSTAKQQTRPLMEAAISSNLSHPNIVTTYSYELHEVEHEFAALSPELARQGGGWRLLIIQEYCDAGPLRRLVDCGFFFTPPKPPPPPSRVKLKLSAGLLRRESPSGGEGSGSGQRAQAGVPDPALPAPVAAASSSSRGSSNEGNAGNGGGNGGGRSGNGSGSGGKNGSGSGGGKNGSAVGRTSPSGASTATAPTRQGSSNSPAGTEGAAPTHGGEAAPAGSPEPEGSSVAQRPLMDDAPDLPARPTGSLEAALRYVEAALMIARGLEHIHGKNIVHGDLNPNNVLLVRAPGTPLGFCLKVSDFGLSVRVSEGQSHLSNLFQGSPYYAAPEVVLSGHVGKSADIYSLGIMLYELQNGTRPPWRRGIRLKTYPSLNTSELTMGAETPPRYARLARECFRASKDSRPLIGDVVRVLASIKADLDALSDAK